MTERKAAEFDAACPRVNGSTCKDLLDAAYSVRTSRHQASIAVRDSESMFASASYHTAVPRYKASYSLPRIFVDRTRKMPKSTKCFLPNSVLYLLLLAPFPETEEVDVTVNSFESDVRNVIIDFRHIYFYDRSRVLLFPITSKISSLQTAYRSSKICRISNRNYSINHPESSSSSEPETQA